MIIPKKASKIDLSNRSLTEFPMELLKCKNLRKLNLSHNKIKMIPKEIHELKYLQNLDISYNEIKVLYAKICHLKFLEVLVINNNQLQRFPEQIELLKKLKILSLANNQLERLPNLISSLPQLKRLDISCNKFKVFPSQIFNNTTLTHLWLSKNIFNEFDSEVIKLQLPALKYLYCFSAATDSLNSVNNDYAILQQKKGNSLELLKLLAKNNDLQPAIKPINTKRKVFISYSHNDIRYRNEIEIWLKGIQHIGFDFDFWSDKQLIGGDIWEEQIMRNLAEAGIVINIISQYYLASDFIQKKELPILLEKANSDGTLVLNIIARRSIFHETKLAMFQAVNDLHSPIEGETKDGQDVIYLALTQRIINEFNNIQVL